LSQIRIVVFEKTQKPLTPTHSNSEKRRHRAEGYATLITSKTVSRLKVSFRLFKNHWI